MSTPANDSYQNLDAAISELRRDGYTVRVRQLVPVEIDVHVRSELPVAQLHSVALELARSGIFKGVRRWDSAAPATVVSITSAKTGRPVLGKVSGNTPSLCDNN